MVEVLGASGKKLNRRRGPGEQCGDGELLGAG